jgi:TRAP transporter TAXI family solute receptor
LDVIDCDARQNYYPAGVAIVVEKRCMKTERKSGLSRIVSIFTENFGLSWSLSLVVVCFISLVTCFAIYWFIHSAPPRILTITSGPPGSTFERNAGKYRAILARNGVTLNIIPSQGSLENLQRLESPTSRVDVGFVQGGVADGTNTQNLISLGNIAYEPLLIFYRGGTNIRLLSGLAGKRLAIGSEGSGAHSLALTLLQTNGLTTDGVTKLLDLDADAAAQQLLAGTVDAVFMMSDSASSQTMRILLRSPGVELLSFEQADAYTRRFNYLNKLRLPEGSIDFSKNLPQQDVWLIGPTVELVARPNLNAAVSDLLLEAA